MNGGGWQGSGRRHEGFQREFSGQTWRLKTSEDWCPPVTWSDFPLLSPLITVSDGKWWKGGGGVTKRWRGCGFAWNAMNLQMSLRVFLYSKVILHQILLTWFGWGKHTNTHGTSVCLCVFFSQTQSYNCDYNAITVGVSDILKIRCSDFTSISNTMYLVWISSGCLKELPNEINTIWETDCQE